jgi:hypothetical protein
MLLLKRNILSLDAPKHKLSELYFAKAGATIRLLQSFAGGQYV